MSKRSMKKYDENRKAQADLQIMRNVLRRDGIIIIIIIVYIYKNPCAENEKIW